MENLHRSRFVKVVMVPISVGMDSILLRPVRKFHAIENQKLAFSFVGIQQLQVTTHRKMVTPSHNSLKSSSFILVINPISLGIEVILLKPGKNFEKEI